jgi:membrane protease YdiL (CAAX protease family)
MKAEDVAAILTWLPFAVISTALLGFGLWFFRPAVRRWELPPQRHRAVPWRGAEVFAVFALSVFVPALVQEALQAVHFFPWTYGPDFNANKELIGPRQNIWVHTFGFPLTVASVLLVLFFVSGTRPYQIGIHTHRLGRNILVGGIAWVTFTPFLMVLNVALTWLLKRLGEPVGEDHALTKLGRNLTHPLDPILLVFTAVIAAPVIEELLFRGVLQPWLGARSRPIPPGPVPDADPSPLQRFLRLRSTRQGIVLCLAVLLPMLVRPAQEQAAGSGVLETLRDLAPVLFILALAFAFLAWRAWRGWPSEDAPADPVGAVFTSALFFAAAHSIWPTPVPLFLLGLVLGWLASRTQSLIAPMVLHALFNGVSCVLLFFPQLLGQPPQPENGNAATSALTRPAAVSTSTTVPGSHEPRRR